MNEFLRASYRITLFVALAAAWIGLTMILGLEAWSGERTATTMSRWAAIWFFSVAAPTIQVLRLRRAHRELLTAQPEMPERVQRVLLHAPVALLIFGVVLVLLML